MTTTPFPASFAGGVLVASPDSVLREQVVSSLQDRRGRVQEVSGGADALSKLESGNWQVLFIDRRLPDLDVEEVVGIIKRRFPGTEVVVLDADGGPVIGKREVRALAQKQAQLSEEKKEAEEEERCESADIESLPGMVGSHPAMWQLYRMVRLIAPRRTTVLITGPTGTGKELVARAIHQLSPRVSRPFAVVNCAAIPEGLLESELFGHARGAFTGALQAYSGRIHAAQGGTLFLDEVGEMPLGLQAKLLRFLDQKEVQRLGSTETLRLDVRVVAATNADLPRLVAEGKFRGDLYYRLATFPLEIPSLCERREDILPLAEHFLRQMAAESHTRALKLSPEAASVLVRHGWEGNVRELQQRMERAAILAADGEFILAQHLNLPPGMKLFAAASELLRSAVSAS